MSKRKNRSTSPNLPQEALERARRQLAGEEVTPETNAADKPAAPAKSTASTPYRPVTETRSTRLTNPTTVSAGRVSRRRSELSDVEAKRRRGEPEVLDMEAIRYQLHHPTKIVTEAELREQYSYVAQDLRSIALLSAGLIIALIVIAQVL